MMFYALNLGLSPNDIPNLKQFLSGKPLRSIERYKVSRIDDIDLRPATMENRI